MWRRRLACGFWQRLAARNEIALDSRGETPLEPAAEDGCATLLSSAGNRQHDAEENADDGGKFFPAIRFLEKI